mmetsp:Transcript_102965/g.317670  ORF Transcript_102965/g.317670 Transcript_102965/m.317670 type:complete len:117 (-) Transcript_102965:729-1079(-)
MPGSEQHRVSRQSSSTLDPEHLPGGAGAAAPGAGRGRRPGPGPGLGLGPGPGRSGGDGAATGALGADGSCRPPDCLAVHRPNQDRESCTDCRMSAEDSPTWATAVATSTQPPSRTS